MANGIATPTPLPADKDLTDSITKTADDLQAAIDADVSAKLVADPTLQDDYNTRDQLTVQLKDVRQQLAACQQRIVAKEGPELSVARAKQQIAAMSPEQFAQFARRSGIAAR